MNSETAKVVAAKVYMLVVHSSLSPLPGISAPAYATKEAQDVKRIEPPHWPWLTALFVICLV